MIVPLTHLARLTMLLVDPRVIVPVAVIRIAANTILKDSWLQIMTAGFCVSTITGIAMGQHRLIAIGAGVGLDLTRRLIHETNLMIKRGCNLSPKLRSLVERYLFCKEKYGGTVKVRI